MEDEEDQQYPHSTSAYADILRNLTSQQSTNRRRGDPRALRLAAVTSALVEVAGGQHECTAARVYAKAVTALEGTLKVGAASGGGIATTDIADSLSTQAALLELLQATVPHVTPPAILAATLPLTSRVLRAVAASVQDAAASAAAAAAAAGGASTSMIDTGDELGGVSAVLRRTCRVATEVLLRVGAAANSRSRSIETDKAVKQLLSGTVLILFQDRRPKVRKAAHGAAIELLAVEETQGEEGPGGGSGGGGGRRRCHPVVRETVTLFAHGHLSRARRDAAQNERLGDCLHLLGFLEHAILHLDYIKLGADAMELFAVLVGSGEGPSTSAASNFVAVAKVREATPKVLAVSAVLSTVAAMLRDSSAERKRALDAFAPRVLASLVRSSPSLVFRTGMADMDLLQRGRTLYGQAVLSSCERVVRSDPEMASKLLPLSVQMIVLLSKPVDEDPDDPSVAEVLMVEATQLFRRGLPLLLESEAPGGGLDKCLEDTLRGMEKTVDALYAPIWPVSLQALVVLMQVVRVRARLADPVRRCVDSVLELRNQVPAGSPAQHAVEAALSSLVQGVGIEASWGWIQWHPQQSSSPGISLERAWILSILKSAALVAQPCPPHLAFFQNEVLPMARACDKLAAESTRDKNFHHAKVADLWSLFSCFCLGPSDIETALPSLTTTLCRALADKRYRQLVTIICGGITSLCSSFTETLEFPSPDSSGCGKSLSDASVKLLPVLFKLVSAPPSASDTSSKPSDAMQVDQESPAGSAHEGDSTVPSQSVSKAISSLAKLAPKPFLQNIFKKLMHRLLEGIQSGSEDSERTCSLLSLSQALVSSRVLDESDVAFLYRVLKPLLKDDELGPPRVQKRAYKVLAEICEQYHSFVAEPDRLKELTALLTASIMTSQVSARQKRLKCMGILVEGFDESGSEHLTEMSKVTAEILLCLKDSNAKTRDAAYQVLMSISSKFDTTEILKTFAAALGAESAHMRSAAVMAFSRLVFESAWEDEDLQAQLPSLLRTILVLMNEDSREVIKSVVGFIRICVVAIPPETLQPLLPELVGSLLTYQKAKDRFRAKIKIILKKLVKLFGYDALMPFVPASETRLLTHMRKLDQRQRRKKEISKREKPGVVGFNDMLDSDEEDSGDGRTLISGATGLSRGTSGRTTMGKSTSSRSKAQGSIASTKSRRSTTVQLPNETDGEVMDMLGDKVKRQVTFAENQADEDDSSDDGSMEFNDDGRLVVHDDAETLLAQGPPKKWRQTPNYNQQGQQSVASSKRKAKSKPARELGAAYKSKKAGGDVKKKNQKYEPYAYLPLDGRSYSKKNRRSAVDQMSSVVRKGGKRKRS